MGSYQNRQTFNHRHFCALILVLFLFLAILSSCSSSTSSSLHDKLRPGTPSPPSQTTSSSSAAAAQAQYQLLYVKNARPYFLNKRERGKNKRRAMKRSKKGENKKTTTAAAGAERAKTRPFAVMLPKGFIPPSGSSPCHNMNPRSADVSFYCDFSTQKP